MAVWGKFERHIRGVPRPRTSFVGRESELSALMQLFDEVSGPVGHLVTLTGAAGVGKTRLAIAAATQLVAREAFVDVGFIDLSGFGPGDVQHMLELLREATQALSGERVLLLVDNFDEMLEASEALASETDRWSGLWTLVTSQRPLGISGEVQFVVPPLATPPSTAQSPHTELAGYDTVRLFLDRARSTSPHFELTRSNATAVAEICRRLDGIPLAIELAAARIRLLPPEALLARLNDRLGLLTGGARNAPARHRTLRAALTWTYQLLEPAQQRILRCLSVFVDGFNLAAAEAVVGDDSSSLLDGVQALLENGLLRLESAEGPPRYRLLETVREYASEVLVQHEDEAEVVRQRYADYYVHPGSRRDGPPTRLDVAEEHNLRDALESVLGDIVERGRRTDDVLQQAIAQDGLGRLAAEQGDLDRARAHHQNSARLFSLMNDDVGYGIATLHLGQVLARADERNAARGTLAAAIGTLMARGERGIAALGLAEAGCLALDDGDLDSAAVRLADALRWGADTRYAPALVSALRGAARLATLRGSHQMADRFGKAATATGQPKAIAAALADMQELLVGHSATSSRAPIHDVLSPREREVAVLLAQGLTNRSIAERLVITEWTADSHVRHILRKLKLRSRAQVAAWAVEQGLVSPSER